MVSTVQSQVDFIDGSLKGYGNGCGRILCNKPMLPERLIGKYTLKGSTVVRAHQHAESRKKGGPETQALGRSVGGFSTKVHIKAEGYGRPMHNVSDYWGTPRYRCLSRVGFWVERSSVKDEADLNIVAVILRVIKLIAVVRFGSNYVVLALLLSSAHRNNQRRRGRFNRGLYRERNRVERLINRLKQYRRIATRYEKYAINYLAMLMISAIRLWL
jgi:hypothetical protein